MLNKVRAAGGAFPCGARFYEDAVALTQQPLFAGLHRALPAMIIIREHLEASSQAESNVVRSPSFEAARRSDRLDARETLDLFMVDGVPDAEGSDGQSS